MKNIFLTTALLLLLTPLSASAYTRANSVADARSRVTDDGYVICTYAEGWDKYSKSTAKQMMEHAAIKKALGRVVLLTLGVPNISSKKDNETNKARFENFDLSFPNAYPAFIFYNKEGHRLADVCITYNERKNPKAVAKRISAVMEAAATQRDLLKKAENASGVEKARLLGQAAAVPGISQPRDVAKKIKEADPGDSSGMHKFVTLNLPEAAIISADTKDWQATMAEMKALMDHPMLTTEHKQQICCIMIGLLRRHGGDQGQPQMKALIDQLRSLDPDSILGKSADDAARMWLK